MYVKLVSDDRDLYKLCRESLAEIPGHSWDISAVTSQEDDDGSDLWLWDYQPSMALPEFTVLNPSKHLFLVNRKDLSAFRTRASVDTHILLKPVTRATLAAFLGLAVSAHEDRTSIARSLRADRDEILQCLIQTNLKLQEYDQDRTTFLTRAVHDFRAPLTAISGYCGLLLGEPLGPLTESQREVLRRMQHSTKRLSRMAGAMFQLSVGRHVKRRVDLQRGDIRECLEQALHEIAPFADDKAIAISTDLGPCDLPLYFEAGQIEQVLINVWTTPANLLPGQAPSNCTDILISGSAAPPDRPCRLWRSGGVTTVRNQIRIALISVIPGMPSRPNISITFLRNIRRMQAAETAPEEVSAWPSAG